MTTTITTPPRRTKKDLARIRRFFQPWPRWVTFAIVATMVLGLLSTAGDLDDETSSSLLFVAVLLGFMALAGALWWLSKPSSSQMDRWLHEDLNYLEARAIIKCQLEDEQISQHAVLTGPVFTDIGADWAYKRERNGRVHVTPVGVTILNFTAHEVFAYMCVIDRLGAQYLAEQTDEYFYRDVVSVATKTKDMILDKRSLPRSLRKAVRKDLEGGSLHVPTAEVFTLTTSGGTSVEAVIDVGLEAIGGRLRTMDGGHVEQVIRQMKKHLRERKQPDDGAGPSAGGPDGWVE